MQKVLFYYCLIFSLFLLAAGAINSKSTDQLLMQLIFLPIPAYLAFVFVKSLIKKGDGDTSRIGLSKKTTIAILLFFLLFVATSGMQIWKKGSLLSKNTDTAKTNAQKEQPLTPTQYPSPTPQNSSYVMVKTDEKDAKVNIRENASPLAKILQKASENEKFLLLDTQEDWYKILLKDGTIGYISRDFSIIISGK